MPKVLPPLLRSNSENCSLWGRISCYLPIRTPKKRSLSCLKRYADLSLTFKFLQKILFLTILTTKLIEVKQGESCQWAKVKRADVSVTEKHKSLNECLWKKYFLYKSKEDWKSVSLAILNQHIQCKNNKTPIFFLKKSYLFEPTVSLWCQVYQESFCWCVSRYTIQLKLIVSKHRYINELLFVLVKYKSSHAVILRQ